MEAKPNLVNALQNMPLALLDLLAEELVPDPPIPPVAPADNEVWPSG
jgi:hypothetical protein